MKEIPLTRGCVTIVDDFMYPTLSKYKWCVQNSRYAARMIRRKGSGQILQYMHKFLVMPPEGFIVRHKNGNSLDNRLCNLCLLTQAEMQHIRMDKPNSSGYRGIRPYKYKDKPMKWRAAICCDRKLMYGSVCDTKEEAARMYDQMAFTIYGERAVLNFPEETKA
jgi:hypothetical protein